MLPSLLSLSAFVSAAPVGDGLAPDLDALTRFCEEIGSPPPTFKNGCYKVNIPSPLRFEMGCDDGGRLIKLPLHSNPHLYRFDSFPESIGNLVNLEELYFNLT
jgi:hypothetical protein